MKRTLSTLQNTSLLSTQPNMAQSVERSCTFLVAAEALPSPAEIKAALEDGDDRSRAAAMRAAVSGVLNGGEPIPGLFITIVRYVLPSEDHTVQKLLLLYLVRGKIRRKREKRGGAEFQCLLLLPRAMVFFLVHRRRRRLSLSTLSPSPYSRAPLPRFPFHNPQSTGNHREDRCVREAPARDGKREVFS